MPRRKRRTPLPLPLLFAQLALASWETIARRTAMMVNGTCSPAEYARMVTEKVLATQRSALALSRERSTVQSVIRPWHRGAKANAKRLRRR